MEQNLLHIENLTLAFRTHTIPVLSCCNLDLDAGGTLALVGESGSGKSLTALSIMNLLPHGCRVISGRIVFNDQSILDLSESSMRKIRGNQIAMIFQEPAAALNPVKSVASHLVEPLITHMGMNKAESLARAMELLEMVRIPHAKEKMKAYPHELSGGMKQRMMIAMALACQPKLLIADEPSTALDVTIQAQILFLLKSLQLELNMAMLFITHDLAIVAQISPNMIVMKDGHIVEKGNVRSIFKSPQHPYTQRLLASIPGVP